MTVRTVARAAEHAETPWVIADPLPLMTAVYSIVYFDDDSLLEAGIKDAATYDVVLWCAPDIPWVPEEGMRDGIDFRDRTDRVIAEHVVPRLSLTRVSGDVSERLATAMESCA
jgi:nicotinamide riboside kinase